MNSLWNNSDWERPANVENKYPHVVKVVVYTHDQTFDQAEWCQNSLKGEWDNDGEYQTTQSVGDWSIMITRHCDWSFERQEDAALFKLFWC